MINVLPQKEKLGLHREYRLRLATVCLCIITFLSVLACLLLLPPYVLSASKESSVDSQLAQMNEKGPTISLADLNVFIEKIKGSQINPKIANVLNGVGLGLLLLLMAVITFHDILNLFH